MQRYFALALLGTALAGLPMLVGCDDKKETSKSDVQAKHADGSATVDKEKTTVDTKTGDSKTTSEHKVTGPTTQP